MKRYLIQGVAERCPLCLEPDGRRKPAEVFVVSCEGGYNGAICPAHLLAMMRADGPKDPPTPPKKDDPRNGTPVPAAVPVAK